MDEFRAPSRPVRTEGQPYAVPTSAGATQTPIQTNVSPVPTVASSQPTPSPGVNPSLLGGFAATQPLVQPVVTPVVAAPRPLFQSNPIQATPQPVATPLATQPITAPVVPTLQTPVRDFSMPRPQAIAQEVAVVNASAAAAQAGEPYDAAPVLAPTAVEQSSEPVPAASPFDIALIEESDKPKNRLRGARGWRKWAMSGGIVGLCLLMGTGGLLFAQTYNSSHKVFRGTGASATLAATDKTRLNGEDSGRVNILLLGNGGLGHEAPDLTDTIIVASIDTVHKTATMLSVPRDLWVQIPDNSPTKLNAAYEIGKYNKAGKIDNTNNNTGAVMAGFKEVDQVIEKALGIDIHYNALVNFTSFKQAVDAVGGVEVNVPEILYDPTMAWENGNNPVLAQAGTQQMDGKKALMYVRSRETSSDFARGQRQRSVILALKSKILTAGTLSNPLKLSGLVNAFGDNMVTDMTLAEGMRAYDLTKAVDNAKVQTVDLVTPPNNLVTTGTVQNASIALPRAGMFNYTDIQKYVQQLFNPPRAAASSASKTAGATTSTAPETATISVLNGTTRAGLAGGAATTIRGAGYNVTQTGNAPSQGYAKTVVVDLSKGANPKTKSYLEGLYGVTSVAQLPDAAIQAGTAQFVVILGSDQVH